MSEKFLMELYERIKSLEEKVNALEEKINTFKGDKDLVKNNVKGSRKYRKLTMHLLNSGENIVKFDFGEIEKLLKFNLPNSAYVYRAFWANCYERSIALSWLSVGYYATEVNITSKTIQFEKRI